MFLKLLVAQLQQQDPTSPMDQKDMMAQMAQMTSVEQMTNMAQSMDTMQKNTLFSQSVGLIGKTVDYLDANNNMQTGATVTSVTAGGGNVKLVLGDGSTSIAPTDVVRVS
jgi:flagellar basal-body rod modification protein FlgD